MFKLTFFLLIFCITNILSQVDTLDTMVLINGKLIEGKALKIKSNSVEFIEASTSIIYEYEKNKIDFIKLASGKTIQFGTKPSKVNEKSLPLEDEKVVEDTIGAQLEIGGGVIIAFASDNYETGTGATIFFELRSKSIVAVRSDFGYYSADTKVNSLSKGNSSFYMIELSLLLRSMSSIFQPYGGIGVGYYFVDNTLDNEVIQLLNQYGYSATEELDNNIGFLIRGGFDLIISKNFGFFGELKYWIYNPNATSTVYLVQNPSERVETSTEIKLNNLSFNFGIVIIL